MFYSYKTQVLKRAFDDRISRDKLGKMTIKPLISMDPFMSKAFKDPQNLVALTTDDDKLVFSLLAARLSSAHLVEYNRRR